MRTLIAAFTFAVYVGIGAGLYGVFVAGGQFDWASPTTYGWLLGWPIMLSFWGLVLLVGFSLAAALIGWVVIALLAVAENVKKAVKGFKR